MDTAVSLMVATPIPHENETLLHQQAWEVVLSWHSLKLLMS